MMNDPSAILELPLLEESGGLHSANSSLAAAVADIAYAHGHSSLPALAQFLGNIDEVLEIRPSDLPPDQLRFGNQQIRQVTHYKKTDILQYVRSAPPQSKGDRLIVDIPITVDLVLTLSVLQLSLIHDTRSPHVTSRTILARVVESAHISALNKSSRSISES